MKKKRRTGNECKGVLRCGGRDEEGAEAFFEVSLPRESGNEDELREGLIRGMINEHNRVVKEVLRTEYEKGRADAIAEMQGKWNEEDEQHIDSLLKRLDALCRNKFERTRFAISEDRNWLQLLKDRVGCEANCTTTKEWSEEDEAFLDDILCKLEHDLILNKDEKDWLKSFRPQNKWKPSDEQIAQLQIVVDTYGNEGIYDPILTELLFQLKKIKGEV